MLSLGVHVWIEVEGTALPEYRIQKDRRRTTCFIPSQEGKKFCVRFQNATHAPVAALRGNIYLDGIASGAGLLLATDVHATTISGQTRWEGLESPFLFAKLRTTDNEAEACQDETRLRELGTVRVQIEWVEVVRPEAWRPHSATSASSNQPVHERSKKASAHCTSLGAVEVSRPKNWYSTSRIPFVEPSEFIFQYAPLDWLRAQSIAPALPVPIPLAPTGPTPSGSRRSRDEAGEDSEDAVAELLDEEEAAVYQRLKAKMAGHQHKKRRKSTTVKQESDTVSKLVLSQPSEIIDLTGDD
ncbi:hypothetical protein JB92DRAFT_2903901 [Gautieria morchelliformis]|nr:hypothetical protein JB92DRAFT_2903901 [Gautieria morchelliformis]